MAVVMPYNFVVYGVWVRYNQVNKSVFIKEGKTMDKEWERLYEEAMSVLNPHDVSRTTL